MTTSNLNLIHGASVMRAVPFDPAVVAEWLNVDTKDPQFEVVYVARETYDDGHTVIAVAYRLSDPTPQPPAPRNMPVKKLPPLALIARFTDTGQSTT